MNEDSFLDSYMESHIGGWTGDEDRYYCDEADEAESYHDYDQEELDDLDSDPEYDNYDDPNDY